MKKTLAFSFFLVSLHAAFAQQPSLPEVSRKVDFAGITVELDADAQKLVQKEVSTLLIPENKYVLDKLQRIQWYFPVIERILELEKVPDDFKYLAVVESSLLPDAVSSSNAVGFWQMKASTAQEMGLRVDGDIDERKNIYASTRAAAAYLKRNNQIYKNWVSTLYSYMLGAGGISKIVPSEWNNASKVEFDGRTDRYLLKTVAARIAFEYRMNRMKDNSFAFVEYRKGRGKTLSQIASMADVDATDLKKYNSWLQTNTIPEDYSVAILVPVTRLDEVQSKIGRQPDVVASKGSSKPKREEIKHRDYPVLERVTTQVNNEEDPVYYTINEMKGILAKPGDDIASLARGGKLKIKDFLLFNDMSDRDAVEEGQVYYLQRKLRKGPIEKHQVESGQTMWSISQMFGVKLKNLLKFNRMRTSLPIQEGQIVYLQKKRPKNDPIEGSKGIKEQEPERKVPVMENYEEETVAKNNTKPKKTPSPEETMTNPGETVVIERTTKRPQPKNEPAKETATTTTAPLKEYSEDDDIVVISEDEDKDNTGYTSTTTTPVKPAPTNPNVTIKNSPTTTEAKKTTPTPTTTTTSAPKSGIHTVDVGQTLYSIARQYKVSVKELAAWNGFATDERVKVGQEIIVSSKGKVASASASNDVPATPSKAEKAGGVATHQVAKGETLFSIAKRYSVAMKQIQEWNNMNDQNVKIGQKLIVRKI